MDIKYNAGNYDVIVIGAGHAGCEAALATARMGYRTLMLTITLDSIAMMPCNPSIGGTGKGHLVREIDALGGEMGINIDKTFIQSKMLNTAKGPAVHSLRAQADKLQYHIEMKKVLENEKNLEVKQGEVVRLLVEDDTVSGIVTRTGAVYNSKSVILATGVYLRSKIFMGEVNYESGPNGLFPAKYLSENLKELGCRMRRFKTGTPARIHRDTIDFSKMDLHEGDEEVVPFSFLNDKLDIEQHPCWLTRTTADTHKVIMENLERSAMKRGDMESIGPRYCPSIEDKVERFKDKPSHQLFIEPEGLNTKEMYLQGMSTSLPEEVQEKMIRTVTGLENVKVMRPAYAIEYDCIDPTQLKPSLEIKHINNLFSAGQFNGTSGYEEAAAQGLIAGINAVLKIQGKEAFILDRSEAYIGVIIDDLVTKGTNEPYRMMTSRAEYRLILRQDNADLRLTSKSYEIGLATKERYEKCLKKKQQIEKEMLRLKKTIVSPNLANPLLEKLNSALIKTGMSLHDLLKRPEINYKDIESIDIERPKDIMKDAAKQCEIVIKYEGYIDKQMKQVEQFKKLEIKKLDEGIDYNKIEGLRLEARQKLDNIKPLSVGQASRISGVSPADISVLLVYLEQRRRQKEVKTKMEAKKLLKEGSSQLGLEIDEEKAEQLLRYKDILLEWNKVMNLTAIEEEKDVIIKHFLDSISCTTIKNLKKEGSIIDVGTGAGFPGIPLKVVYPNLKLTLLDSLNKRINFLKEVCTQLNLREVDFIHGRAEDYGQNKEYREKFDYAVARAVAPLNILVEYCLPFVKVGGFFICQKGKALSEELKESSRAIEVLGGKVVDEGEILLPFSDIKHSILVIEKTRQMSTKYPRKAGTPTKNPIR